MPISMMSGAVITASPYLAARWLKRKRSGLRDLVRMAEARLVLPELA